MQNNPAETIRNEQYIHNGKGTAIIKNKKAKTQKCAGICNN